MIDLTNEQIAAAKDNDLEAVTAVIRATEERVSQLARRYATEGGRVDEHKREELEQIGRIAVWESLSRFQGEDVAQFFTFMDRTVKGVLTDSRKEEQRRGVKRQAAADFEYAVKVADGDPYLAEFLVTTTEVMGKRKMSQDLAYACRLSWQGIEYLDAPLRGASSQGADGEHFGTLGDTLAETVGVPEDLLEPGDYASEARKATTRKVHYVLKKMGEKQRALLCTLTGIEPYGFYGNENDEELAKDLGYSNQSQMRAARSKAKDRFAALWLEAFGK